jgi:ADP-ribose pyrophosphatase YjhB (NUDIX family)
MQRPLPEDVFQAIQKRVPIACVDVLALRNWPGKSTEVGLIYRDTPHQGRRWCLIGGRVYLNETFRFALDRHIYETLGRKVHWISKAPIQPLFVAEYLSKGVRGALYDPRQHAIASTFAVKIRGTIEIGGEAFDFKWFHRNKLPTARSFGFGQSKVVEECLFRLDEQRIRRRQPT